jgi:hypothetical protein
MERNNEQRKNMETKGKNEMKRKEDIDEEREWKGHNAKEGRSPFHTPIPAASYKLDLRDRLLWEINLHFS